MNLATLNALAEPNRLNIVELLREGPLAAGEIAERLELNNPQTSKHLRVLSDAGIAEVLPIANRRIYKLRSQPFDELSSWLDSFRLLKEEKLNRFDQYLKELQRNEQKSQHEDQMD
ncbi:ArsR/SmtB family transcription factor [Cohnella nanjingensis]|uniref:Winged helix-turn-helix transcriptional regulator n=1 Tax=Cohnella nanjingensis TaxID=1387779 RepID=A0A7X0VHT6_9BACL|nr:metalloregulator ArsR/SmtB family transcription factor [Cohnella nanjingensis]MBB6673808.1 winged helix-turn-helix transcriptional regulator [Cohnella nanjingensis]